ncbi:MAG: UDP-3-O-(3-hydroxymyristoyl)glucosamine N-acyltransferase, partial [Planctomycetaceae bacterium]
MTTSIPHLADLIGAEVFGDKDLEITGTATLENATSGQITFLSSSRYLEFLPSTQASAIIIQTDQLDKIELGELGRTLLIVADAMTAMLKVLEHFHSPKSSPAIGISPRAEIGRCVQIGENTNVHPGAYIADGVVIGTGCDILPGVSVGADCVIGNQVTLHPGVVLYSRTMIGDCVTIHANSVIGADGFGYRQQNGKHEKIPHFGHVEIQDHVEIGACTTVDRAMIGQTVIGAGTKIDNLVMVAHNCDLGQHNLLAGQSGMAGSVTTGDYVVCAGQVGIADHVHLGPGAVCGGMSGVHQDVGPGQTYLGLPAANERQTIKIWSAQKKLPEMRVQLKQLQQQVA